jgi:hypothetical protein
MKPKRGFVEAVIVSVFLCLALPVYAVDVNVTVNAASPVRTIPETMYGGAMTAWWGFENGYNATYNNLMLANGQKIIRWPGGSWGDAYLWSDMEGPNGANTWIINYDEELYMLSILDAEMQPIVNFPGYWYNTDHNEAVAIAAAVAWVQDQSGRTPSAKYWELGNETGGFWEAGFFVGISGTYYGDQFADFYLAMKAVNPNIKIGADAEPTNRYGGGGSQDYVGYWDHDLLLAAKAKGVVPDFFIIHQYPGSGRLGSYNPTLLSTDISTIATYKSNMNTIISNTIGSQYVGQIGYFMTEWNAGGVSYDPCHPANPYYERWRLYSGAMFMSQYLMEMAKNGWEGSTTFGDFFYQSWMHWSYPDFYVFPDWYLYPFFINKFGRNMVTTTSSNSIVRAYASMDANDNLTMFIVNNSPDTNLTAQISITGITAGTGGQRWIMEPAGTVPSGGTVQDVNDIKINGVFHPAPTTVNSLAPQTFTSGSIFTVSLPKSCMVFLKVPTTGVDTTAPAAPTGLTATAGVRQVALDWNNNSETDLASYNVYRSTTSGSGYSKLNNLPVSSSNYTDYLVVGGTTYYYVVTAVDKSWNESDDSNEVSAMPTETIPPAAPKGLTAVEGYGTIALDWNDNNESDLAGYNVYRSTTSGSGYSKLNTSLLSSSNYTDNDVVGGTTYYYVVRAKDTSGNESSNSSEVAATPSILSQTVYNFVGINQANTYYDACAFDVKVFPFAGLASNRNSGAEANDQQYINISANDSAEWTTINPGSGDEIFLWVTMKINELPADINKIDLTFNGYTDGSSDVTHRIFVLKAGADWTLNSSWVQVGSDQNISPGAYATMTRSVTSNISDYINGAGKIVWGVYETTSSESMHINYLEMVVTSIVAGNYPPTVSITSPLGGAKFAPGDDIVIEASASDSDGSVAKVEFYQGSTKIGEDTTAPYSCTWTNAPVGHHTLTARAIDNDSSITTSSAVNIEVIKGGAGKIISEAWGDLTGTEVNDLTSNVNYPDKPTVRVLLTTLEWQTNVGDNYGVRIRGYVHSVADGDYTFWIASADNSELWLSTDADPCHISKIAYVSGWTDQYQWDKYPQQESAPISMVGDRKYYIEVLYKAGSGSFDNLAVAWERPGVSREVIDGRFMSPCCFDFRDFAGFAVYWHENQCEAANSWCYGADFDNDGTVLFDDLKAFVEGWLAGIE